MEKVECGLLADVTNFLKTVSDIVFKAFDKLNDLGVFTEDIKKTSDGGFEWDFVNKEKSHKIHCVATPKAGKDGFYDVTYKSENGKTYKARDIAEDYLFDAFKDAVRELYSDTVENWVVASSKLKVALKRIVGEAETSVELCGINSSLPIKTATDILNNILVDEFIDTIPEEETWYAITEVDDSYDVNECEPLETLEDSQSLYYCLREAFSALSTCQVVHWNAKGKDFFTLHEKLDEYIEKLQGDIDELAELIKEENGTMVPAPAVILNEVYGTGNVPDPIEGFDAESGFRIVHDAIMTYCQTLDYYYVNLRHDVQSKLDEILGYWIKEAEYKLAALLEI